VANSSSETITGRRGIKVTKERDCVHHVEQSPEFVQSWITSSEFSHQSLGFQSSADYLSWRHFWSHEIWAKTWIRHSLAATCCLEGVPCPHAAAINKPPLPDHSFVNFAFNRHISTDKNRTKTKEGRSYACEPEKKQEQGKESDLVATIAGGANRV
jgi:hypothetical protein